MEVNFKNLRVPADYPTYPPYHKGDYLEEYFYKFYKAHKDTFDDIKLILRIIVFILMNRECGLIKYKKII